MRLGKTLTTDIPTRACLTVLYTAYIVVNKAMLGHFNCTKVDGGSLRVSSDYRVICYSAEWWRLFPFALAGVLVYMVCVLWLFVAFLSCLRGKLDSSRWKARTGLLFEKYSREL